MDQRMLVIGYLSTVAHQLDQQGFLVRELHAQQQNSPRLWGHLTLDPAHTPHTPTHTARTQGSRWVPARLGWDPNTGWSATLLPDGGGGDERERLAVSRYLPGQLVPAPVTVAHFATALYTDVDTVWARATLRPPRRIDHRWLILQLARFAMPEPW